MRSPEAAAFLCVSMETLRRMIRSGKVVRGVQFFDGKRNGKRGRVLRLWKREALVEWLEHQNDELPVEPFQLVDSSRMA